MFFYQNFQIGLDKILRSKYTDIVVKILLPLITELVVILSPLHVCCDMNIFFLYCLKTLPIHENCASSVKVIGSSDGMRWKLFVREWH